MIIENKLGTDRPVFKLQVSHSLVVPLLIIYLIPLKLGSLSAKWGQM